MSEFTDNNLTGDQLARAYLRLSRTQAAQEDRPGQPSLAHATDGDGYDEVGGGSHAHIEPEALACLEIGSIACPQNSPLRTDSCAPIRTSCFIDGMRRCERWWASALHG